MSLLKNAESAIIAAGWNKDGKVQWRDTVDGWHRTLLEDEHDSPENDAAFAAVKACQEAGLGEEMIGEAPAKPDRNTAVKAFVENWKGEYEQND